MSMLRIGWASQAMTPQRPAMTQGQMHRQIGRDAMAPLTCAAMATEAEDSSDGAMPAVCRVGPEGGQKLVEETLSLIHGLFAASV